MLIRLVLLQALSLNTLMLKSEKFLTEFKEIRLKRSNCIEFYEFVSIFSNKLSKYKILNENLCIKQLIENKFYNTFKRRIFTEKHDKIKTIESKLGCIHQIFRNILDILKLIEEQEKIIDFGTTELFFEVESICKKLQELLDFYKEQFTTKSKNNNFNAAAVVLNGLRNEVMNLNNTIYQKFRQKGVILQK
ncbi:hypothetical protein TUBRATIS_30980 [Tubulinosema ratisbonensis]|uniref:Uncharacterized protein n=1 Tax=Tubulinosema ratisbonensis TaxID=291195 RepID=A0A437AH71_9MICR|nr:hypothetical protein TUBRATIS_30980 [Tubulinosema ratisbonensis]